MRLRHGYFAAGLGLLVAACHSGSSGSSSSSPPPTATLTAAPTVVASGAQATLTWSSTNSASCVGSGGWAGTLATSGSQSVGPITTNTTYTLVCTNSAGKASSAVSATVNVTPTATLTASPSTITTGASATLTWSSANATSCTASGAWSGAQAASGSTPTGALTSNTTYGLTCSGAGGTSSVAQATVTVVPAGAVTLAPTIATLTLTQSQQFTATVPGGVGAVWTVDGVAGGNSSVGLISSGGLYTPGTAVGTHTIIAASIADASESANATVVVTDLTGVTTYHDDNARDGANTQEYALTPANVNTTSFGKLFSCTVDGAVYAQPLWVAGLTINGTVHNVVFVATAHDSLYAFDADQSPCQPLWQVSLIDAAHGANSGETTVPAGTTGNLVGGGTGDITPEVGVIGTPVIDASAGILYVVSKSVSSDQATFYQRLHAIDLLSGNEKGGSPALIAATYPGSGDGSSSVAFNARQELQRAGLALVNGTVYIAWASHEDKTPYYGWVMGYQYSGGSASFTQTAVLNVTPNVQYGGIWMGGGAPAADSSNNLYLLTGNGTFDVTNGTAPNNDYGDSLLQLSSALSVEQYFTPSDQASDNSGDHDFGSGGAAILADLPGEPVTHLIMGGGKDGSLYVLNRDSLGGLDGTPSHAVQQISLGHGLFVTGAYWNFTYYVAGLSGPMTAYALNPAIPQFTQASASTQTFGFPGSTPSISANVMTNGIVWALNNSLYCTNQSHGCGAAVLYAYNAGNVATELWDSSMVAADQAGNAVKFTVPTVANGKVYIGTRGNNTGGVYGSTSVSGELDVYGLK